MTGITLTPIIKATQEKKIKKKKVPDICVISDEEDNLENDDFHERTEENLDFQEDTSSLIGQNSSNKNEDCEIVFGNEIEKIIDITEVEDNREDIKDKIDVIALEDRNEEDDLSIVNKIVEKSESKEKNVSKTQNMNNQVEEDFQCDLEGSDKVQNQNNDFIKDSLRNGQSNQADNSPKEMSFNELSNPDLIEYFLDICKKNLENTEYDLINQFDMFSQYYKKCEPSLVESNDFRKLIESNIKKAKVSPSQAVISFGEVFMHLKDLNKVNSVEVTKKKKLKLKKMEHTIKLLVKKIKDLENAEVDFSDEEDSSYMKLNR